MQLSRCADARLHRRRAGRVRARAARRRADRARGLRPGGPGSRHAPRRATTNYRLASVTQAVHRRVDPAARARTASSTRRPRAQVAALAAEGRGAGDDPPPADAHVGTHRLRRRHRRRPARAQLHDADVLRLLESQNRTYFAPGSGYRYSNSGYALLALIVERASGRRFATFLRERIFQPLGMSNTVAYEEGISTVEQPRLRLHATSRGAGRAPIRARPARCSATAASTRRSTTWRSGTPRSTTNDCCATTRCSGLHAGDAHDDPEVRVRLRLAHHRRDAVALRRDGRLPQRDRALSAAAPDGRRADQSQRPRAVSHRARDRGAVSPK